MKRYRICFLFLMTAIWICLAGIFFYTILIEDQKEWKPESIMYDQEVTKMSRTVMENGTLSIKRKEEPEVIQVNQSDVKKAEGEYYLVEENGFLMVFCKDKTTLSLHTHMPITDFPSAEQQKLTEGIWFSTMLDVLNYLESYTS